MVGGRGLGWGLMGLVEFGKVLISAVELVLVAALGAGLVFGEDYLGVFV